MKFSEYNFLQTLGENYWEILFALESRKHQKEIDPRLLSTSKRYSEFLPTIKFWKMTVQRVYATLEFCSEYILSSGIAKYYADLTCKHQHIQVH